MDIELARSKVQGPAIGLIVISVLSILQVLLSTLSSLLGGTAAQAEAMLNAGVPPEMVGVLTNASMGCGACLGILFNVITLVAGIKMRGLQSYGLCIAGSILATLPCGAFCCCFGLGVGVWSLLTLSKDEVKNAFQAQAAGGV